MLLSFLDFKEDSEYTYAERGVKFHYVDCKIPLRLSFMLIGAKMAKVI